MRLFAFIVIMRGIIVGNRDRRRPSRRRTSPFSRRLEGRDEETWEGARYVRPLNWTKNVLRKRYLSY